MTFARIVLAFVGGYAVASAAAILVGALPGDRGANVLAGTLAAIAVWVAATAWLFAQASLKRALLRALGTPLLMVALALLLGSGR